MCRKFCEQLRLEARVPSHIKSLELSRMVAYEIIRLMFGQPFNRYAWIIHPPQSVVDYHSDENFELGKVISAVVSIVTKMPPEHYHR
jgi:hypothetical protein